ncbi:MAG TPA: DUF6174 domain-containing protein [Longimicrobiales bacterium]|nr:DUF6174 domain-containing protein [Longimicrobiales bacterium]
MSGSNLKQRITFLAMLSVLLAACDLIGPDVWQQRRAEMERQRAIWEQRGVHDYVFTLNRSCGECLANASQIVFIVRIRVEADTVRSATYATTGEPVPQEYAVLLSTIDDLFDGIAASIDDRPYRFRVEYDPADGYPTSWYVDPIKTAIDDEHGMTVSDLVPLCTTCLETADRAKP